MKHKGNRPVNRARPGRDARREKALNFFCGAVYISQKVHWFQEQPSVTGRIRDSASLGGRNTGST